jgi:hypothetical protein
MFPPFLQQISKQRRGHVVIQSLERFECQSSDKVDSYLTQVPLYLVVGQQWGARSI